MSACNFLAPNGEPSLLYAGLEQQFGEERAVSLWYSAQAISWKNVEKDSNGEPTLQVVTTALAADTNSAKELTGTPEVHELTVDMFTKDGLTEPAITNRVKMMYTAAAANPEKTYQVPFKRNTPGIKITTGNRISMTRMAEIFAAHPIPDNVKFHDSFAGLMTITPTRILNDMFVEVPSLIPVSATIIDQQKEKMFLKVRDDKGNPTGNYFSYYKQQEAIDSVVYLIYSRYLKGISRADEIMNSVEQVLRSALTKGLEMVAKKSSPALERRVADLQQVLNVLHVKGDSNSLWNFAVERLKMYGLNLRGLNATSAPTSQTLLDMNDGQMLRDYSNSSFELDKKDTASSRIKLFLSSIESTNEYKRVKMSFTSALVREQVLSGDKNITLRTPEQALELGLKRGDSAVTMIDGKPVKVTSLGVIDPSNTEIAKGSIIEEDIEITAGMTAYKLEPQKGNDTAVQQNYLGLPKLVNFEDTYQKLMATMADQEPTLENFRTLLTKSNDPVLRRVGERLDQETDQVKNEFVSVMSNQYQEFNIVLFKPVTGRDNITRLQTRSFKANFGSQVNVLLKGWEEFQKEAPIASRDQTGLLSVNKELAKSLYDRLNIINATTDQYIGNEEKEKELHSLRIALLRDLLQANGIEMDTPYYDNFVKNIQVYSKGTRIQGTFPRQFAFNKDGSPAGVISAMIARLNGVSVEEQEADNTFQVDNPFYTEGTAMNILARSAMPFIPMVYSNSHRSSEGKSIYDHGLHTSLSHKVRRLKSDEQERLNKGNTYINEHSWLLSHLHNDPEARDRFEVTYMDGIKPEYMKGTGGTPRNDMSPREQLLFSLAMFEKRGNKKYADYISLTHSDKTTSPIFLNGPRISVVSTLKTTEGPTGTARVLTISDDVYRQMFNVFLDEYNRVTKTTESYNAEQFDKGKKFFYAMPEFNHDSMKAAVEAGEITKEQFNALWTDLGAIKPIETAEARQLMLKLFNKRIDSMTNRALESWKKEELVTEERVPFSQNYMNRLLGAAGIHYDMIGNKYMTNEGNVIDSKETIKIASLLAARDYAVNHYLFNVSVSRLLFGDPAEVYKGNSIHSTMVEYSKRLAKDIAPGKDGQWSHSPLYTTVTVEDWEGPAPEVQELVSAYGEGVNATDAQEFITTQEYLDGLLAVGQISKKVYDEMSQIIKDGLNTAGYYEFTKPEHKIIMQPQKPVYVGEGALDRGVILTHYVKSSAVPLLPAFTVGKDLDRLRITMEVRGIARLNFKSAKKMGRPGAKLKLFNKDGSMDMAAFDAGLDANKQTLDRRGFRIQQEIPYDGDKRKIGIVTQMNTLITQGLATISTPFTYFGQQYTAQALIEARTNIRQQLFDMQASKVYTDLGYNATEGKVTNFNKLYDQLQREAQDTPGYTINDLEILRYRAENGQTVMPLIFSPSRSRFESLLMNKISSMKEMKMYGKSFVQMSSAGIRRYDTSITEEQKAKTVFVGDYRGENLKMLRKENGEVKAAQVLVPFRFFGSRHRITIDQFTKILDDGTRVIDHEKLPAEFLQMIGARIPNQGHSSMLPMEIVGFLPDEMGDTIIVPAAITKQMGSDFDVDKLYTYQRPYEYQDNRLITSSKLEEQLLNNYFELHWSVLNNPEMTEKILSPLDKPDLKLEAEKAEAGVKIDYFDPIEQLEQFQSTKFARQLVGYAALSLTNNAIFEALDVKLGQLFLNDESEIETRPYALNFVNVEGQVHELTRFSGNGVSTNYDLPGAPKRSKTDNIIMMLSGFLDHAKDPVTPQINLNLYTYNAASALLRLESNESVSVGIPEMAALLRQPAIKKFSSLMAAGNDSLSQGYESDLYGKVMEEVGKQYRELAGIGTDESIDPAELSLDELRDDLTEKEGKVYALRQYRVLRLFDMLWKAGAQIANVQSAFNWSVGGAGPSILSALSKETAIDDARATNAMTDSVVIQNLEDMYGTEQGYGRGQMLAAIKSIGNQVFPYENLQPLMEKFKSVTGAKFVSPKVQEEIISGYLAYQWTDAPIWQTDEATRSDRVRLLYTGMHGQSLARRVQDAKRGWGRNNYLLQRIDSDISQNSTGPDTIRYGLGISSGMDAAEIARSWSELLTSDNEQHKRLGEDIARYAILTGNSSTLARHIPVSYILGSSLIQATENLQAGEAVTEIFTQQFIQHNPQYAAALSVDMKETGQTYEEYPESFTVLPIDLEKGVDHPGHKLWRRDPSSGLYDYPQFLSYRDKEGNRWVLYQQTNYLTYERVDTLGTSQIDEYSPIYGESVFPENKAVKVPEQLPQPEKQYSSANRFGLPQKGTYDDLMVGLQKIAENTEESMLHRQMAGILSTAKRNQAEQDVVEDKFGKQRDFIFSFVKFREKNMSGNMATAYNSLTISETLQKERLAEVLIHELLHYHSAYVVLAFDPILNPEYHIARFGGVKESNRIRAEQLAATYPEVFQKVKELNDVRKAAFEALRTEYSITDISFDELTRRMLRGEPVGVTITPQIEHFAKLIYALSSNQEFISHVFTSRDVIKWLNMRKYEQKRSFLDKISDILSSIIEAAAKFLGIEVNEDSMLKAGMEKSLAIVQMKEGLPGLTTVNGITDINPEAFNNAAISVQAPNPIAYQKISIIVARLEDQKREIRQTFTGSITKEQATRKRKMLDQLDQEIARLKDEQDLTIIAEVGKTQLKWVNDIMARPDPDANDIMVADRILELWTNLINVMYGDANNLARVDQEWANIASEAQVKRQQLTNMAIDRIITESGNTLRRSDFNQKELTDADWAQVRLRSLSAASKSRALQYIATHMEETGRMVNEEILRMLNETKKLEDDFIAYAGGKKNLQGVYNMLMQENKTKTAWGLVRRYTGAWYGYLSDAKYKREKHLDTINRDKSMSQAQKTSLKKGTWKEYWGDMHYNAAMVDTRLFFDEHGELKADTTTPRAELAAEVGEELTDQIIQKAQARYKEYLEEKEIIFHMMEADVKNGVKTQAQADAEVQEFIGRYSPNVFFNNFKNEFAQFNTNTTDRFVIKVPRAKHAKFFDKKFQIVKQDKKLYELYSRLHAMLNKMKSYLPKNLQYELGENFLPVVQASLLADISGVPEYIKGMPDRFVRSLTASVFEENNKGAERIPINYINTSKEKDPAEIASRSRDLVKITELFGAMATHYKHFAGAKDVIDMGQSIIREIDRTRVRDGKMVDEAGRVISAPQGLKNALDAIQYMKEYMMYKRGRQLEGKTGLNIYSLNPVKQRKIASRVKELTIKRKELDGKLLQGEIDGEQWKDQTKAINEELAKYEGKPIYGSKVGDKLIGIQQAKALSFNPFSGVANFTFGLISSAVFANGRQEFGWPEWFQSFRTMMSSTGKWLSFGTGITADARKIMNTMDRLGVMGDVVESSYGKMENRQRIPNWKKTIDPYSWLRSGDYFCRGQHMIACLLKEKVKVTVDGQEKEISLWEAIDNDGKWDDAKYGLRPEWHSENVEDQKEWNRVRTKIARVNMVIMGNVDRTSPKMANKWILGRLLGQFRLSWLPEGWYNRWADEKYDTQLQRHTKGRFTTYKDLGIGGSLKILGKQYASLVSRTDPFTGQHKMNGEKISAADIENMRKNFAEINFYLMVLAAMMMIRGLAGGDDDDESQAMQILINMIIRTKQDIAFYSSPEVFDTITRNAVPAFGVVKDYMKAVDASWKVMTDDDYTADRWALKMTKAGLPIPQATLINKIKYMSERDLDDISR